MFDKRGHPEEGTQERAQLQFLLQVRLGQFSSFGLDRGFEDDSRFSGKVYLRHPIFSRKAGILNSNGFLPKISVKAGGRDQEVEGSDHVLGVSRVSTSVVSSGFS